jgi:hypothetical protein
MAMDPESSKKLQLLLAVAILIAAGRAGYIVYERHEAMKEEAKPKQEVAMKADNYVTPKKLRPYDLKSARQLTEQPVWVKAGYQLTYYPYDPQKRKADFAHAAGTLPPLKKLSIEDVVTDTSPEAPGAKQVMAVYSLDGKHYAVPIGAQKESEFKFYSDDAFFNEDPHDLYKHWPADVWSKIEAHEVQAGMSELQTSFAIGAGAPEAYSSGQYGSRTLHYTNGGKPMTVSFENDKAVEIKAGS